MIGRAIRVLELEGDPAARGRTHGSVHAQEIRDYAADRVARSGVGTDWTRDQILDLAEACLPAHREYSPGLYEEMTALAAAAGITPAEALIVGGYTDFIDTVGARAGAARAEDTCTAVLVPPEAAAGAGLLAQTWDMHASATPHIVMARLRPTDAPAALVFTTVGCLGQIGLNEAGIAIGINNLTAADGAIGVTWPFVVRAVLQQTDLDDALGRILDAPLAGGHNYLLMDATGEGYSVEAMPSVREVTELGAEPWIHTNHCLVPATRAVEGPRPAELDESSRMRLEHATGLLADRPVTLESLVALTRDERSICRRVEPPFDYESCGAAIMRPGAGELWACWGVPSDSPYELFRFEAADGTARSRGAISSAGGVDG